VAAKYAVAFCRTATRGTDECGGAGHRTARNTAEPQRCDGCSNGYSAAVGTFMSRAEAGRGGICLLAAARDALSIAHT
jgi:hypothetical protein